MPQRPPVQPLDYLRAAGFSGDALRTAWAVMMAESGGNARAHNPNAGTGDNSYGLFQINMLGNLGPDRLKRYKLGRNEDLFDPRTNAQIAYAMSKGGTSWGPWSTYKTGAYKKYLDQFPGGGQAPAGNPRGSSLGIVGLPEPAAAPLDAIPTGLLEAVNANNRLLGVGEIDADVFAGAVGKTREPKPLTQVGNLPVVTDARSKPPKATGSLLSLVQQFLGTPYAWGGGGPQGPSEGFGRGKGTVGFDCSSFLQFLMAKQGVKIPRVTYDQWRTGKSVGRTGLRPGDAVFFRMGERGPEHVGVYIGNGQFAHAPKTGDVIKVSSLNDSYYKQNFVGGRRYA